jgi:hypothetical protein
MKAECPNVSKCSGLQFFALDQLPINTIGYIREALYAVVQQKFYIEIGW